jgi:hypothetical protein
MHILSSIVLVLGAIIVLVLGLLSVLRDLIERGPYEAPLVEKDALAWPPRYQGAASSAAHPADSPAAAKSFADTTWQGEQERG